MTEEKLTYCRICEAACGLIAERDEGGRLKLRPDDAHPSSAGFVCVKGTRFAEIARDPRRLMHPARRRSDGVLEDVSWERAMIEIGPRLRALMPEGHTLTEYVWHRFGAGMYVLTLTFMTFYMFIYLTAELTAMALAADMKFNPVTDTLAVDVDFRALGRGDAQGAIGRLDVHGRRPARQHVDGARFAIAKACAHQLEPVCAGRHHDVPGLGAAHQALVFEHLELERGKHRNPTWIDGLRQRGCVAGLDVNLSRHDAGAALEGDAVSPRRQVGERERRHAARRPVHGDSRAARIRRDGQRANWSKA